MPFDEALRRGGVPSARCEICVPSIHGDEATTSARSGIIPPMKMTRAALTRTKKMQIKNIDIENYRSFFNQTRIPLDPGMNLILGENNSGKSTILDVFSIQDIQYTPHLSLETKKHPADTVTSNSSFVLDFILQKEELWRHLGDEAIIPLINNYDLLGNLPHYLEKLPEFNFSITRQLDPSNQFTLGFHNTIRGQATLVSESSIPAYRCLKGKLFDGSIIQYNNIRHSTLPQCLNFLSKIYRFRAERINIHTFGFGTDTKLNADAGNLPQCLNSLQSNNPDLFNEYNEYISSIFPSVYRVQVAPAINNQLEIRIWLAPPESRRTDISISLSQCGTGIGQVLAILYVAMSA